MVNGAGAGLADDGAGGRLRVQGIQYSIVIFIVDTHDRMVAENGEGRFPVMDWIPLMKVFLGEKWPEFSAKFPGLTGYRKGFYRRTQRAQRMRLRSPLFAFVKSLSLGDGEVEAGGIRGRVEVIALAR